VARAGVRKLVLFNSHGGQVSVMDIVARDLRTRCELVVFSTNWFTLPLGDAVNGLFSAQEHRFGIHAGDMETSMMLALRPEHVDMAQARDFRSTAQDRNAAPHRWATAAAPSSAGRCRTTTRWARPAMPRWPPPRRAQRARRTPAGNSRCCCRRWTTPAAAVDAGRRAPDGNEPE
jgi:creatinine amidohydrolase/Fe(II)-dependent formamide hydrolase-like protein